MMALLVILCVWFGLFAGDIFSNWYAERWIKRHGWCPQCGQDAAP